MDAGIVNGTPEEFVNAVFGFVDTKSADDLRRLKDLLSKSASLVGAKLTALEKEVIHLDKESTEGAQVFSDTQFLEPRGRFCLRIGSESVVLEGKSGIGSFPLTSVTHLCLVPSHTSSKKEGEDYLIVIFSSPQKICGKNMNSIVLNLSKQLPKNTPSSSGAPANTDATDATEPLTESRRIGLAFKGATGLKVHVPSPRLFVSASQQKPFVRCHKGVQEGAIYPLSCGLVFFKPLIFLPADEIASFTAGRGGGSGNTRFVDLQIETADETKFEFSNVDREELAPLNAYVKGFLEARRKKAENMQSTSTHEASQKSAQLLQSLEDEDDDDDDDEDDDDYDPDASDSDDNDVEPRRRSNSDDESEESAASDSEEDEDEERTKKSKKGTKRSAREKVDSPPSKRSKPTIVKEEIVKEEGNVDAIDISDEVQIVDAPEVVREVIEL